MDPDSGHSPPDDDNEDQFDASDFAEDSDNQTTGITEPRDTDVMCGRGGAALRHPGNQTYRKLVNCNKALYITCLKTEKLKISRSIVAAIRAQNGRFLEKDNASDSENKGKWYDIGDKKAVEKTSQALREGQPKLRQKIAELGNSAVGANGIPLTADINPHSLPYAAPQLNQQSQIMLPPSAATSNAFHGSLHSMGSSSFNMNESGLLSTGASIYSLPYPNQAEIVAVRNNNGSFGVLMPPPPTPPFLQHQNGANNGATLMRNVSSYTQDHQEYQVQRIQAAENPHHHDIQLNNMMSNSHVDSRGANAELMLQPDLLQRLSLHDVSVSSSSMTTPSQNMGTIDSGGFHLQPSSSAVSGFGMSIRTVDSSAVNSIDTFNSLNNNNSAAGVLSSLMNIENLQQRLAFARELGIEESQLSLLSNFAENSNNGGYQGVMNVSRHTMDTQDSFKNAINNLPMNRAAGVNNHPHLNNVNMNSDGLSQINLDYNTSMTSCVSNHSAFNLNGTNGMANNMLPASGNRSQVSTSFQQYRQNQQQNQQQQLQQRQQMLLQQRQQQQLRKQQQNYITSQHFQSFTQGGDSNGVGDSNGGFEEYGIQSNKNVASRGDNLDRRQVFATMKFSRPPSVREQDPGSVPASQTGQIRQQQPLKRQQPEVTKIKINDGNNGGRSSKNADGGNDYFIGDSNHSICSNFSMNTAESIDAIDGSPLKNGTKKNEVVVETAKVRDHSSKQEQARKEEFMSNNNGSKRSIMSGCSEVSMFSDLSRKIGNVSTRSMAMSEMSSVDHLDMEEPEGGDDDDDVNNLHENENNNIFNDDKQHLYEDDNDLRYRAAAEFSIQQSAQRAIAAGAERSEFNI